MRDALPATLQSVSPSVCTTGSGVATCALGSLASQTKVTVTVTVIAPAMPGTITNVVDVSYDEGPSDSHTKGDPKTDTLHATEATDVTNTPGDAISWAPPGITTKISTDPSGTGVATSTHPEVAQVTLQAPAAGAVA